MAAFAAYNLWDAVIAVLTPIVPTYKEYAVQASLPFARIEEGEHSRTYLTRGDDANQYVISEGRFFVHVQGPTLDQTRKLVDRIAATLNSLKTKFKYANGSLMNMEPTSPVFHPEIETAPGSPSVFPATLTISYCEQRTA